MGVAAVLVLLMPSAVETNGAQKMKTGAIMMVNSKSRSPEKVPPRASTTMDRMNATKSIGPAISHAPKPKTGMSERPQVRKMTIQPARAGPL